jgi:C1A family cysteine protease
MKKFTLFLTCIIISFNLSAQKKLEQAPLNPEFKKYQKNPDKYKNEKFGYIPPPFRMNFDNFRNLEKTNNENKSLPSSYDLRAENAVTLVKDQNPYGTCWAFAAMASLESRWKILDNTDYNLSEKNLVTCSGYLLGVNDGGNQQMSGAYITRLDGPIAETDDPYGTLNTSSSCNSNYSPVAYSPEARWLPDNIDEIKRAVMNYGAIATSMYWASTAYNSNNYTYHYEGPADGSDGGGGHAVTIVGWDDNKTTAGGTGAWIIKNSWGPTWGESGYFYLSYHDTQVLRSNSFYPVKKEKEFIDSLYMYDKLGMVTSYGFQNDTAYAIIKYEAETIETIHKIGSYINSCGTEIDIELYDDFNASTYELSNLLDSVKGKKIMFPGYHTFDLTASVNNDFYIKVKYVTPGHNYPIPVERAFSGYSDPEIQPSGFQWVSGDEEEWYELGSDIQNKEYDLCIRAYSSENESKALLTSNKNYLCTGDTVIFTNKSIGNIDSLHWYFGNDANPTDTSGEGPIKVTYSARGNKNISLAAFNSGVKVDSIFLQEYIIVEENLHIFFENPVISTSMGTNTVIKVNGYAENYTWEPQTGLQSTNGPEATVLLNDSEEKSYTYSVTGSAGSCSDQDSIKVIFSPKPANDDVCDAMVINEGINGPFNNSNATVQENEPLPETNSCTEPLNWCNEGGLQNSLWFKYKVTDSAKISFITKGMDTQIALYGANSCEDILNDNYTLIAANDDYFGEDNDYAAALMDVTGLENGETYWLQMDGSAEGATGDFTIEIKNQATGFNSKNDLNKKFEVFPNPSNGEFAISFNNLTIETVRLQLYSIDGKLVYEKNLNDIHSGKTIDLNLPNTDTGIYFLQLQTEEHTGTKKIIVQ